MHCSGGYVKKKQKNKTKQKKQNKTKQKRKQYEMIFSAGWKTFED